MGRFTTLAALSLLLTTSLSFAAQEKKKPIVFTKKVSLQKLSDPIRYPAQVFPEVHASVLAETAGIVSKILAPFGSTVKKGQKLLILKHTDPIYNYAPVVLRSPISGQVNHLSVSIGETVKPGQTLLEVADPSRLKAAMEITFEDLPNIPIGTQGTLKVTHARSTLSIPVQVVGISPMIDPATGTAKAEMKILDTKTLRPGAVGQVEMEVNSRQGIVIPERALTYRQQKPHARVVIEGKAKSLEVKLGAQLGDQIEIISGLKESDELIVRSSTFVGDGTEVEIYKKDTKEK